jgi:hypothetical protein
MLISANIGRVSENRTRFINRNVFLSPFRDYLLRGRGANIEITFHLVRNPEIKIGEVDHANRWFRSYHRRYFLRKFDFIGRGGNSGREIQYFFEVVCSTIFLYQVRSGISVRMLDILFIFSVSLKYSHWTRNKCIPASLSVENPTKREI